MEKIEKCEYQDLPTLLTVKDVMVILGYSYGKCADVIRKLNKELEQEGHFTISCRVSKDYFFERMKLDYLNRKVKINAKN